MLKNKNGYVCEECGHTSSKWVGKCPACFNWNSFTEKEKQTDLRELNAFKLSEIKEEFILKSETGIAEFDRVLGRGLSNGSLILIAGDPGVGKSTLVSSILCKISQKEKVLFISGEETISQNMLRINRLGPDKENFYIANEKNYEIIEKTVKRIRPKVLVIDSIQTCYSDESNSAVGSNNQVKDVTLKMMELTKSLDVIGILIGHITKDGSISGPKLLEHMVDVVLYFEKNRTSSNLRVLRSKKNRFGPTDEVGYFKITSKGIENYYQVVKQFKESIGKTRSVIRHGSRTQMIEISSLVIKNKLNNGKRVVQNYDNSRLLTLVAIIEKYMKINLSGHDIYINIEEDLKKLKTNLDLAIVMSILSSIKSVVINNSVLFYGEILLSGNIKNNMPDNLLKELERLGIKKINIYKHKLIERIEDILIIDIAKSKVI